MSASFLRMTRVLECVITLFAPQLKILRFAPPRWMVVLNSQPRLLLLLLAGTETAMNLRRLSSRTCTIQPSLMTKRASDGPSMEAFIAYAAKQNSTLTNLVYAPRDAPGTGRGCTIGICEWPGAVGPIQARGARAGRGISAGRHESCDPGSTAVNGSLRVAHSHGCTFLRVGLGIFRPLARGLRRWLYATTAQMTDCHL